MPDQNKIRNSKAARAKYRGMQKYDATHIPSGGTAEQERAVSNMGLSPKNPQSPGNENKKGVKIKEGKTSVPRNPKPQSKTAKRLMGRRI